MNYNRFRSNKIYINEMNGSLNNIPMYDSQNGTSIIVPTDNGVSVKDGRLVKELYYKLNKIFAPYVEAVIDEYEYVGSPIYQDDGLDRETVAQIVDKVIMTAEEAKDELQEISLEDNMFYDWSRQDMLKNMVQSLVQIEIFMVRRPQYRRAKNNYVYNNGMYVGVNPQ